MTRIKWLGELALRPFGRAVRQFDDSTELPVTFISNPGQPVSPFVLAMALGKLLFIGGFAQVVIRLARRVA